MSVKTSITEVMENSNKRGGRETTNRRRYDTDEGALVPRSDAGLNKTVLASVLVFHALVAPGVLSEALAETVSVCFSSR